MKEYEYPLRPDIGKTSFEHEETFLCSLREMKACCQENNPHRSNAGISERQWLLLFGNAPRYNYAKQIADDLKLLKDKQTLTSCFYTQSAANPQQLLQLKEEYNDILISLMQRYAYPVVPHNMLIQHEEVFIGMLDEMFECCQDANYEEETELPDTQIEFLYRELIPCFAKKIAKDIAHIEEQRKKLATMHHDPKVERAEEELRSVCACPSVFVAYLNALKNDKVPLALECIKLYAEKKHLTLCLWQSVLNKFGYPTNSLELLDKQMGPEKFNDMHILCKDNDQFYSLNVIANIHEDELSYSESPKSHPNKLHQNLRSIKDLKQVNKQWLEQNIPPNETANTKISLKISINVRTNMAVIISTNFKYALNDEAILLKLSRMLQALQKEIEPQLDTLLEESKKTDEIERIISDEDCQIFIKFTQKLSEIIKIIEPTDLGAKNSKEILQKLEQLAPYFAESNPQTLDMPVKKSVSEKKNGYPYSGGAFSIRNPYHSPADKQNDLLQTLPLNNDSLSAPLLSY
jgi:hypothetical protein